MEYGRRFKFLICAPAFDPLDLEGARLHQILSEIEEDGYIVLRARQDDDAELVIRTDAAIDCVVVDWDKKGVSGKSAGLINLIRKRGLDVPIIVPVRRQLLARIGHLCDYILFDEAWAGRSRYHRHPEHA